MMVDGADKGDEAYMGDGAETRDGTYSVDARSRYYSVGAYGVGQSGDLRTDIVFERLGQTASNAASQPASQPASQQAGAQASQTRQQNHDKPSRTQKGDPLPSR